MAASLPGASARLRRGEASRAASRSRQRRQRERAGEHARERRRQRVRGATRDAGVSRSASRQPFRSARGTRSRAARRSAGRLGRDARRLRRSTEETSGSGASACVCRLSFVGQRRGFSLSSSLRLPASKRAHRRLRHHLAAALGEQAHARLDREVEAQFERRAVHQPTVQAREQRQLHLRLRSGAILRVRRMCRRSRALLRRSPRCRPAARRPPPAAGPGRAGGSVITPRKPFGFRLRAGSVRSPSGARWNSQPWVVAIQQSFDRRAGDPRGRALRADARFLLRPRRAASARRARCLRRRCARAPRSRLRREPVGGASASQASVAARFGGDRAHRRVLRFAAEQPRSSASLGEDPAERVGRRSAAGSPGPIIWLHTPCDAAHDRHLSRASAVRSLGAFPRRAPQRAFGG